MGREDMRRWICGCYRVSGQRIPYRINAAHVQWLITTLTASFKHTYYPTSIPGSWTATRLFPGCIFAIHFDSGWYAYLVRPGALTRFHGTLLGYRDTFIISAPLC